MMTQYLGGFVVAGVWLGLLAARWTTRTFPWFVGWALSAFAALAGVIPWLLAAQWHMVDSSSGELPLAFRLLRDSLEGTQGLVRRAPWEWFGRVAEQVPPYACSIETSFHRMVDDASVLRWS